MALYLGTSKILLLSFILEINLSSANNIFLIYCVFNVIILL